MLHRPSSADDGCSGTLTLTALPAFPSVSSDESQMRPGGLEDEQKRPERKSRHGGSLALWLHVENRQRPASEPQLNSWKGWQLARGAHTAHVEHAPARPPCPQTVQAVEVEEPQDKLSQAEIASGDSSGHGTLRGPCQSPSTSLGQRLPRLRLLQTGRLPERLGLPA